MASRYSRILWSTAKRSNFLIFKPLESSFNVNIGISHSLAVRNFASTSMEATMNTKNVPTKETLLRIDWMLEKLTPEIMKTSMAPFFDICKPDVSFDDRIFNYKLSRRSDLHLRLAKMRLYFRYLSPYNKFSRIGSCIYEGEDVIVLLWRLETLESNMWTYLPSFFTKKEPKIRSMEGALDIHVTTKGEIYKVVNRKITAADREGARLMSKMKETQGEILKKAEEKALKEQGEAIVEEQKRRGLL